MVLNETINLGTIGNYVSYLPRKITEEITTFLNNQGLQVTQRWGGLLVTFLSLLILYIGVKISKPLIKWILIILALILILGILIPNW